MKFNRPEAKMKQHKRIQEKSKKWQGKLFGHELFFRIHFYCMAI